MSTGATSKRESTGKTILKQAASGGEGGIRTAPQRPDLAAFERIGTSGGSARDSQIRGESEGAAPEVSRDTSVAAQFDQMQAEIDRLDAKGNRDLVSKWLAALVVSRRRS
jgi:hypothetical protein